MKHCRPTSASCRFATLAFFCAIVPVAMAQPADPLSRFLEENGWSVPVAPAAAIQPLPALSSLVVHTMGFLGVPYRLGGESFDEGFDCSGFVQAAFRQSLGVGLPRRAVEQAHATQRIQRDELIPGDLVFFNTLGSRYSHVGIYVGEGRFIHSPRSGASVRMENMNINYWRTRFTGARRVVPEDSTINMLTASR